jgi:hypothetical protein
MDCIPDFHCPVLAEYGAGFCMAPEFMSMVVESTCEEWAENDGEKIGMASADHAAAMDMGDGADPDELYFALTELEESELAVFDYVCGHVWEAPECEGAYQGHLCDSVEDPCEEEHGEGYTYNFDSGECECGGEGMIILDADECEVEWCGHADEACCVDGNSWDDENGDGCESSFTCNDEGMCVGDGVCSGDGFIVNDDGDCEWCGWITESCCSDGGCEEPFVCNTDLNQCYYDIASNDWGAWGESCHAETCHDAGHWIEVDFGDFETIEECHHLCACHPGASAMQFSHDGWCACLALEDNIVFVDAVGADAEHLHESTECVICDVDALPAPDVWGTTDDCGVEETYCVYDMCQDGGIWTEVAWHEDEQDEEQIFDIETCINRCACAEEARAMQFNPPTDDAPGFCGCLAWDEDYDTFNHAIHHDDTWEDDNDNGCVICNVQGVMGFSCHEYEEDEECMDSEEFAEWNDGVDCEAQLEIYNGDCDVEIWPGEPIGLFCAASCDWCEEGECIDAEWFEEEYGQSCEAAVGGTGEWTDACEEEAWPEEPIYWFCPVACGECVPEDDETSGTDDAGNLESSAIAPSLAFAFGIMMAQF